MTHAVTNSKRPSPKLQLKYHPKDVLKVMDILPRDQVLDLMENSGPGRKLAAQEPILRAYYLSRLAETWVPKKPHAVYRLLKENCRNLADLCGFQQVPCWETLRKRFKMLEEEYGNEITNRQVEIRQELRKRNLGKKALPIIAKHQHPKRRNVEGPRSNHQHRKARIDTALGLFELIEAGGTDELGEWVFMMARWPDGRPRRPRPGCGSGRVVDQPGDQLQQWLCLECEERFDIKTATVFEGTGYSLRTILWAAYLMLQIPFGVVSLVLACLLKQGGRRLSHKDALDIAHRIQIALIEPHPRFANHPVQIDDSLMGYSNLVRTNVIGGVDTSTRRAWVEPIYGPVNLANSSRFIAGLVEEGTEIHTDGAKNLPENLRPRKKVIHAKRQFARDDKEGGPRISTNLDENFWSTFQESLDRRRAVTATYLPLYLAEHLWRYNHGSEPTLDQLQAVIRNAHAVVLRGDDKPCDARSVGEELAIQLALHPPHPKNKKARAKKPRSSSNKKKGGSQQKMLAL